MSRVLLAGGKSRAGHLVPRNPGQKHRRRYERPPFHGRNSEAMEYSFLQNWVSTRWWTSPGIETIHRPYQLHSSGWSPWKWWERGNPTSLLTPIGIWVPLLGHHLVFPLCLLSVLGAPSCPCLSVYVCGFCFSLFKCFMFHVKKKW